MALAVGPTVHLRATGSGRVTALGLQKSSPSHTTASQEVKTDQASYRVWGVGGRTPALWAVSWPCPQLDVGYTWPVEEPRVLGDGAHAHWPQPLVAWMLDLLAEPPF